MTTKTVATEHLSIAAFRPTLMANILSFPKDSYEYPRTVEVEGNPYARKLLFSKFKLVSQIPYFKNAISKHKIYQGFDIEMQMNSHKTLEVIVSMKNTTDATNSKSTKDNNLRTERNGLISIIKRTLNIKQNVHFECYRSKTLENGFEFTFHNYDYTTSETCGKLAKLIKREVHYYDVKCLFTGVGLIITCTRQETKNLNIPYGLTTLPEKPAVIENKTVEAIPEEVVEKIKEPTVPALSFKQQIVNTLQCLMNNGLSIKTIQQELGCSAAELLDLLDINGTIFSYPTIEKLSKLAKVSFVI